MPSRLGGSLSRASNWSCPYCPPPTPISAGTVGGRAGSGDDVGGFLSNAEMDVSPGERAELAKAALRSPGGLPWRGCRGAD